MDGTNNELQFEIDGDQSYIPEILNQLQDIKNIYGDNFGMKGTK